MKNKLQVLKSSIGGYLMRGKKKGDINYFLGILIIVVVALAILAIVRPTWPATIATALKSIVDKAIAAIASGTGF